MGVDTTHILGKGILLKNKKMKEFQEHIKSINPNKKSFDLFYDFVEDYIPSFYQEKTHGKAHENLTLVVDGMNGEYIFIGYIDMVSNSSLEDPVVFDEVDFILATEISNIMNETFVMKIEPEDIKHIYIPHYH